MDKRERDIRQMWQVEVLDGVFIHPVADIVQEMGNKGYDTAAAEEMVARGHTLYENGQLLELIALVCDIHACLHTATLIHPERLAIPTALEDIRACWPHGLPLLPPAFSRARYLEQVHGAWLGKSIGGALGLPVEGWPHKRIEKIHGDLPGYLQHPPETLNDDTGSGVLLLHTLEEHGLDFTSQQLGKQWVARLPLEYTYTAEKVAIQNMLRGLLPPLSGEVENPYNWWIGGQMKGEVCGLIAPGLPDVAAEYAYRDGVIAHSGEGVYGEIFDAVLVSAAFFEPDPRTLLELALAYVPPTSTFARVVRETTDWCQASPDWRVPMQRVYETWGTRYHWVHTFPNIALVVIGLLYGAGDFERTLRITARCGLDTDCNAGQAAAILGTILGAAAIPPEWKDPLGDRLETYVVGYEHLNISTLAARTCRAGEQVLARHAPTLAWTN